VADVESATECRGLSRRGFRAKRYPFPIKALPRQRKDISACSAIANKSSASSSDNSAWTCLAVSAAGSTAFSMITRARLWRSSGIGVSTHVPVRLREVIQRTRQIAARRTLLPVREHGLRERDRLGIFSGAFEFGDFRALRRQALRGRWRTKAGVHKERQTRLRRSIAVLHDHFPARTCLGSWQRARTFQLRATALKPWRAPRPRAGPASCAIRRVR
jgi:hypothetical protein